MYHWHSMPQELGHGHGGGSPTTRLTIITRPPPRSFTLSPTVNSMPDFISVPDRCDLLAKGSLGLIQRFGRASAPDLSWVELNETRSERGAIVVGTKCAPTS